MICTGLALLKVRLFCDQLGSTVTGPTLNATLVGKTDRTLANQRDNHCSPVIAWVHPICRSIFRASLMYLRCDSSVRRSNFCISRAANTAAKRIQRALNLSAEEICASSADTCCKKSAGC